MIQKEMFSLHLMKFNKKDFITFAGIKTSNNMKKIWAIFTLMMTFVLVQPIAVQAQNWVGTWATAVEFTSPGDMPASSLSNRSVRNIIRVSLGGSLLRLKLSNEFSRQPVEITSVMIADVLGESWQTDVRTTKYLKFNGKQKTTIPSEKVLWSDPIKYALKAGQRLAITISYGAQTPEHATSHRGSRTTSYIIKGEARPKSDFDDSEKVDHWYNLSALDVQATDVPVVAVLGNSITDGRGTTTNKQNRWTDFMAESLNTNKSYGVLNLGIGGNCVVRGGLSEPALKRFDRDILGQSGVKALILFEGTNDIGLSKHSEQIVKELIEAYQMLSLKAKNKGIKIYGATITPFKGSDWYSYFHEAARQTVNEWIRNTDCFDGIIDFDKLVRNPQDTEKLKSEYSDDWLHLNPKGYEAMGRYAATILGNKP